MKDLITQITTKKYDQYKMYELFYTAFTNDKTAVVEHHEILKGQLNTNVLTTIYYCVEAYEKIEFTEVNILKKRIESLELINSELHAKSDKLKNRSLLQRILNKKV